MKRRTEVTILCDGAIEVVGIDVEFPEGAYFSAMYIDDMIRSHLATMFQNMQVKHIRSFDVPEPKKEENMSVQTYPCPTCEATLGPGNYASIQTPNAKPHTIAMNVNTDCPHCGDQWGLFYEKLVFDENWQFVGSVRVKAKGKPAA